MLHSQAYADELPEIQENNHQDDCVYEDVTTYQDGYASDGREEHGSILEEIVYLQEHEDDANYFDFSEEVDMVDIADIADTNWGLDQGEDSSVAIPLSFNTEPEGFDAWDVGSLINDISLAESEAHQGKRVRCITCKWFIV